MKVDPMYTINPQPGMNPDRQSVKDQRTGDSQPEDTRTSAAPSSRPVDSVELMEADIAAEKARSVAEHIRQRQESGFYHRTEVLRAVAMRLMDSGDLE